MPALGQSYLGETYLGGPSFLSEEPPVFPTGLSLLVDSAIGEFVAKQGDSGPAWRDILTWSDGSFVNLQGCSVQFVLRNLSSRAPVVLSGRTEVDNPFAGGVVYSPSVKDTALAGSYMASWVLTLPSGEQVTAPTEGYREVRIEPSLVAETRQLVSLGVIKEKLGIEDNNHKHDSWFVDEIEAVRPLIEEVTGPILPQIYEERYDGGSNIISLMHAPTYGWGTEPVLTLLGVSEFRGPIEFQLDIVSNPVYGSIYSCELDPRMGEITRRTAGGGTIAFFPGRNAVKVTYLAGLESVPANVERAAIETIKWWFLSTQPSGQGYMTSADAEAKLPNVALPFHALAMLQPTRRAPSIG